MGDMGDFYNGLKHDRKALRERHGRDCPRCPEVRPRATPSILLPQQRCKVDGYVDPRPRLTAEQVKECTGWEPA